MEIKKVTPAEYPMDLLYLADPSKEMLDKYLGNSQVYGLIKNNQIIGVCVVQIKTSKKAEIMNIAINEKNQNQGLGRYLLEQILIEMKQRGIQQVEIATGNSSVGQLHLYQSLGFKIFKRQENYFIEHYSEPIFENGIQCIDQIWLKKIIT